MKRKTPSQLFAAWPKRVKVEFNGWYLTNGRKPLTAATYKRWQRLLKRCAEMDADNHTHNHD